MDVILLEKIGGLGDLGDKVSVRSGYGRNFLLPTGKAVIANEENLEIRSFKFHLILFGFPLQVINK